MTDEGALRDMQRSMLEMARAIGGLESTVKNLTDTWSTQETNASLARRDLHQKFDGLAGKVGELGGKVDVAVEAFEIAKMQAIGGIKVGKALWLALPFGGGGLMTWLLTHWLGPRPPLP